MLLNPDRTKEVQKKKLFSAAKNTKIHSLLFFINSVIKFSSNQKHVGLIVDSKLSLNEHLNDKIHLENKGASLFHKNCNLLRINSLIVHKT